MIAATVAGCVVAVIARGLRRSPRAPACRPSSSPQVVKTLPIGERRAPPNRPSRPPPGEPPTRHRAASFLLANATAATASTPRPGTFLTRRRAQAAGPTRTVDRWSTTTDRRERSCAGKPVRGAAARVLGDRGRRAASTRPTLQGRSRRRARCSSRSACVKVDGPVAHRTACRPGVLLDRATVRSGPTASAASTSSTSAQQYLVRRSAVDLDHRPAQLSTWLIDPARRRSEQTCSPTPSAATRCPRRRRARTSTVTSGNPTKIEIPGSAQLDAARPEPARGAGRRDPRRRRPRADAVVDHRRRHAGVHPGRLRRAVHVVGVRRTRAVQPPPPEVYYLRNGRRRRLDRPAARWRRSATRRFLTSIAASPVRPRRRPGARGRLADRQLARRCWSGPSWPGCARRRVRGADLAAGLRPRPGRGVGRRRHADRTACWSRATRGTPCPRDAAGLGQRREDRLPCG